MEATKEVRDQLKQRLKEIKTSINEGHVENLESRIRILELDAKREEIDLTILTKPLKQEIYQIRLTSALSQADFEANEGNLGLMKANLSSALAYSRRIIPEPIDTLKIVEGIRTQGYVLGIVDALLKANDPLTDREQMEIEFISAGNYAHELGVDIRKKIEEIRRRYSR